jgi:hypothetical protein
MHSTMGHVISPLRWRSVACPFTRYQKVTFPSPDDTSRWLARGPPRRYRMREVGTPAPWGSRSRKGTGHLARPSWFSRLAHACGRIPAGSYRCPWRNARGMVSSNLPRQRAMTTRDGSKNPFRNATHRPVLVRPQRS